MKRTFLYTAEGFRETSSKSPVTNNKETYTADITPSDLGVDTEDEVTEEMVTAWILDNVPEEQRSGFLLRIVEPVPNFNVEADWGDMGVTDLASFISWMNDKGYTVTDATNFNIDGNTITANITGSGGLYLEDSQIYQINALPDLESLNVDNAPNITHINLSVGIIESIEIAVNNLESVILPSVFTSTTLLGITSTNLPSLTLPTSFGSLTYFQLQMPAATLIIPTEGWDGIEHFVISNLNSSTEFPVSVLGSNLASFNAIGCGYSSAFVNAALANIRTNCPNISGINLSGNNPPTGQGITDKNWLISQGVSVTTD